MFAIWPHGQATLMITMKIKRDHQLPFLDVIINQHPVISLGYAIYSKATDCWQHHICSQEIHHHHQDKQTLSATRPARPQLHVRAVLRANCYSMQDTKRVSKSRLGRRSTTKNTVTKGHTCYISKGTMIVSP